MDIDWDNYRSLLAVLDEGSLSAAARQLGLTQPTLGRHIEAVERALDQPLFVRSQRGLAPTPAAEALRPYLEALQANAAALARAASRDPAHIKGAVRLTASDVVAAEVLPFVLAGLADAEPGLSFDIEGSNRNLDLLSRAADIAVRMSPPQQQSLVAVRIGDIALGLYATPGYVARRGKIEQIDEIGAHRLIGFDRVTPYIRSFLESYDLPQRDDFILRTDSDLVGLGAIRAGFGVGFCQEGIARREGWTRMLPALSMPLPCFVVMHEDLKTNPACRRAFDALVVGMRAYVSGQDRDLAHS